MSLHDVACALLEVRTWTAHDLTTDGRVLAGHDETGSSQLVEITPDGRRTPLTALTGPCSGRYLPTADGTPARRIVVEHDTGGDERMQLSLLDLDHSRLPATVADLVPLVRDPAFMHVLHDVTPTAVVFHSNRRNGVDMDVLVHDLVTGAETVAYGGGGWVQEVALAHGLDRVALVALSLVPNGSLVTVAGPDGVRPVTDPDEPALHEHVHWTPDDRALLLSSDRDRDHAAVVRVPLDPASPWETLVADPAHDLSVLPSPAGDALLVGTLERGAVTYAVHEPDGRRRAAVQVPAYGMPSVRWSPDGRRLLVAGSSPTDPGSVWVADAETGAATRLVDGRAALDADVRSRLVEPTAHLVPAPDGEAVPVKVHRPHWAAEARISGATVVHVHGGPESMAHAVFNPSVAALVAAGFTVVQPDVRGSTGYGKRWTSLDDLDKRLDSVADLAAVHAWLPSMGLDPSRAALWGGSYGGYMVLAGLTMQPQLWAAGVDIVGISSLVTFLENTSAYRRAYREREYGSLATDREMLVRFSPITHLDALQAPLFAIHGANDPRVPVSEAEQIHAAVSGRGIPCELRVYADEGHGLARRANRLDAYPAAIAFLADVVGR